MGAGVALQIAKKWPIVKEKYLSGDFDLGEIQFIQVGEQTAVCNIFSQRGLKSNDIQRPFDINLFKECLSKLQEQIHGSKKRISLHFPKVGCGLGGSVWAEVEPVMFAYFQPMDYPCYIYSLPPKRSKLKDSDMGLMKRFYPAGKDKKPNTPEEMAGIYERFSEKGIGAEPERKVIVERMPQAKPKKRDSGPMQADLFGMAA
jgi:hypothetical protein